MSKNLLTRATAVAFAAALLFTGAAMAGGPIATATVGSTQIDWAASGTYALELTVSGPNGFYMQRTFDAGQAASFSLFDQGGNTHPAGSYTYELRAIPQLDQATRDDLAAAREAGTGAGTLRKAGKLPAATEPMSGAFAIRDGAIVMGGAEEAGSAKPAGGNSLATKDQVILDDLIVVGSECVGQDCANNENFGFDTLRLKENNLRIKFQDTSNSGSFPSNDWQITANDSTNGGANKFSIDDIDGGRTPFTIEAGTPTNTLYVDSSGRVGIGTSSPVVQIHTVDGNTPALRLEQDGSSGFTPQTWDVAGNETNFFVRDATNGSKIPFKIRPNADTGSLVIENNGDVTMVGGNLGIGTTSPDHDLAIVRSDAAVQDLLSLEASNATAQTVRLRFKNAAAEWFNGVTSSGNLTLNAAPPGDSGGIEMFLTPTGDMTIAGTLTTGGPSCGTGCDRVFSPDYDLESIEQHAAQMWGESHLPAVGPTSPGSPFNVSEKTGGIINELEKAHIYIEQLNREMKQKDEQYSSFEAQTKSVLEEKDRQIDELTARLDALERAIEKR